MNTSFTSYHIEIEELQTHTTLGHAHHPGAEHGLTLCPPAFGRDEYLTTNPPAGNGPGQDYECTAVADVLGKNHNVSDHWLGNLGFYPDELAIDLASVLFSGFFIDSMTLVLSLMD